MLRTRMLQTFVNIRNYRDDGWNAQICSDYAPLYAAAFGELCFWKQRIYFKNFRPFHAEKQSCVAWTDASDFAVGGFAVKIRADLPTGSVVTADNWLLDGSGALRKFQNRMQMQVDELPWQGCPSILVRDGSDLNPDVVQKEFVTHRNLDQAERAADSNERELIAACHLLDSCAVFWQGEVVLLYFDNLNAATICVKGSSKCRLQRYAEKISKICLQYCIDLRPVWIPRDLNFVADYLSKCYDYDDHQVTKEFFDQVVSTIGTLPAVDRFACNRTAKVPVFYSSTFCPGTSGVNAFNYDWGVGTVNWIFPPLKMVGRVLAHLKICRSAGFLLVPQWKNAFFYPLLLNLQRTAVFKGKWVFVGKNVFLHGADKTSYFGPGFVGNVEIWYLDFNA